MGHMKLYENINKQKNQAKNLSFCMNFEAIPLL